MITRGVVLQPENSIDVEPDALVLYDLSRGQNNGAMFGAGEPNAVQLPSGLWVWEYDANDDWINCGAFANNAPEFWVWMWFILDSTPNGDFLFHKDDTQRVLVYFDATPVLRFRTLGYGANFNVDCGAVTEGVWHHLVVKLSSTAGSQLWVDTVSLMTEAGNKYAPDGGDLYIGNSGIIGTDGFSGRLSPTHVSVVPSTHGQIIQDYEKTKHWFGVDG